MDLLEPRATYIDRCSDRDQIRREGQSPYLKGHRGAGSGKRAEIYRTDDSWSVRRRSIYRGPADLDLPDSVPSGRPGPTAVARRSRVGEGGVEVSGIECRGRLGMGGSGRDG
jgi:hypothetical protein